MNSEFQSMDVTMGYICPNNIDTAMVARFGPENPKNTQDHYRKKPFAGQFAQMKSTPFQLHCDHLDTLYKRNDEQLNIFTLGKLFHC